MNSPLSIGTKVPHYGTVEAILFNCGERYYMLNSGRSVALIPAYVAEAMVKSTQPSDIQGGQ